MGTVPSFLPHSLGTMSQQVLKVYPSTIIYGIGNTAHKAECSDHNKDSRGIVHAIDVMVAAGTAEAIEVLHWMLTECAEQCGEYVIHDDFIYRRSHRFAKESYKAVDPGRTDPHTNHIHFSAEHGTVGKNSFTCTGYDTAAEKFSAPPIDLGDVDVTPAQLTAAINAALADPANLNRIALHCAAYKNAADKTDVDMHQHGVDATTALGNTRQLLDNTEQIIELLKPATPATQTE